jgi:hypothetical protein
MNCYQSIKQTVSSFVPTAFIGGSALALEVCFLQSGMPPILLLAISSLVIGALGNGILQEKRRLRDQQRQFLEDRLETVSEINHQVRNVLGVVAFYGVQTKNPYTARLVSDALVRMEGIMRGVLCKWGFQQNYSACLKSSPNPSPTPRAFPDRCPPLFRYVVRECPISCRMKR